MSSISHALRLFIAALWPPAGKGLASWLLLVMFIVFFITFPCGILGQVWYLIDSFPDLCLLSYFAQGHNTVPLVSLELITVRSRI